MTPPAPSSSTVFPPLSGYGCLEIGLRAEHPECIFYECWGGLNHQEHIWVGVRKLGFFWSTLGPSKLSLCTGPMHLSGVWPRLYNSVVHTQQGGDKGKCVCTKFSINHSHLLLYVDWREEFPPPNAGFEWECWKHWYTLKAEGEMGRRT